MDSGKESILRRMSLLYTGGGDKINVLSIIEQVEPDMPDYDFSPKDDVVCREGSFIIEVEDCPVFEKWMDNYHVWEDKIGATSSNYYKLPKIEHHEVLTQDFDDTKLTEILPFRKGPYYVISYVEPPKDNKLKLNEEELGQLSSITEKRLGFDVCKYQNRWGGMYMVWHHPIIKDIHFTASDSHAGMLCTMTARKSGKFPLFFTITDFDKEGKQIGKPVEIQTDIEQGKCLLQTNQPVTCPDVEVRDENGEIVFAVKKIIFIRKIVLNMGVIDGATGEKEVAMEKDVIAPSDSRGVAKERKGKEKIAKEIVAKLKGLPREEQELILENVKRMMED